MKYFRKLQTYWFILNHVLEITDGLSGRLDALEDMPALPKKRKSVKKPKEKK